MEMTRQRHTESVRAAVYDDCPYCKGRGKVKSALTMSVEIQRKLSEILKKRSRDESDFQLRIVVHPTVLERLRTEDEKHLIEMEKRYFGKLSFRADPAMHAEQFKIVNVATNEELASDRELHSQPAVKIIAQGALNVAGHKRGRGPGGTHRHTNGRRGVAGVQIVGRGGRQAIVAGQDIVPNKIVRAGGSRSPAGSVPKRNPPC